MTKKRVAAALAAMLSFAIVLSYAANKYPIVLFPFDLVYYLEVQEEAGPLFNILMLAVSALGGFGLAASLTIIIAGVFVFRKQWLEAIFVVVAAISSTLLSFALKDIIQRPRPFPLVESSVGFIQQTNQYSYPSGHVLFFVVFFGFLVYLAWMYLSGILKIVVIALCTGLILLIGPSRVFLGAHWATDVLGSYIIGALWLFILILAYQWVKHSNCPDKMF